MKENQRQVEEEILDFTEKCMPTIPAEREAQIRERACRRRAISKRKDKRATRLLLFITSFACLHIFVTVEYILSHYVILDDIGIKMFIGALIKVCVGIIFGAMAEYIERRINK